MLLKVKKYSFINAKIRGMKSHLFGEDKYRQLMGTTQLDAFVKALMETGYSDELLEININETEITDVTKALDKNLIAAYETILKFFNYRNESAFIAYLVSRFEVENLKVIIRGKFKGLSAILINDSMISIDGLSKIDYDRLINSKDIEEFVSSLGNTRYGSSLKQALPLFMKEKRTALLERPLEESYYLSMFEALKSLTKNDSGIIKRYLGTVVDCFNIMVILRHRIYYNVPTEVVRSMIIPMRFRLTIDDAKSLSQATEENYRELFEKTYYGKEVEEYVDLPGLEMELNGIMADAAHKALSGSPFNIGTIIGFLALKELEVSNLKCIAEGKRHHLAEGEIKESLVM